LFFIHLCDLCAEKYALVKEVAEWRRRIGEDWGKIRVVSLKAELDDEILRAGDKIPVVAEIELGDLKPGDVAVELYHGQINDQEEITNTHIEEMKALRSSNGVHIYEGTIVCQYAGRYGFSLRVVPGHHALSHRLLPGLIVWA